ncbi:hypothetical protein A9K55_007701 [Cordyceps militaris]|nr:hypothetical protein A9K55_007701 [Cordyceps militaris]
MFSKTVALALIGAAAVQAAIAPNGTTHNGTTLTVTEVVDVWTTYCPEPTHLTMNNKTYTVTEACTFTITDCPCTITRTIPTHHPVIPANNNHPANNDKPSGNKGPAPTAAPPATTASQCPGGKDCAPVVVAGAGQNTAAYGMALVGVLAAGAFAL